MKKGIPLSEAAKQLGIDKEALRKRALRGSVEAYKDPITARWFIILPPLSNTADVAVEEGVDTGMPTGVPTGIPASYQSMEFSQALLDEKDARIALLSRELERRNTELDARSREIEQLHVLLQNTQRLLGAPQTSPNPPQEAKHVAEQESSVADPKSPDAASQSDFSSFWSRIRRYFVAR